MHILLVEDDAMLADAVRASLQPQARSVDWVADAAAAQLALLDHAYTAVLLDLGLPRGSGLDVLEALRERYDATPVLMVVARGFETMASANRQRLSLEAEPCVIDGHLDELGMLTSNLIDNALRYAGENGRIAISCHYLPGSEGRVVSLRVADDGPGVPESERQRIFDRFYRVAGSASRGSGIGLSLVARIAELHRATIEVGTGLQGRGFSICVQFPVSPDAPEIVTMQPRLQATG